MCNVLSYVECHTLCEVVCCLVSCVVCGVSCHDRVMLFVCLLYGVVWCDVLCLAWFMICYYM